MNKEKSIRTEIIINSSKEVVWKVLTTFNNYRLWNSFITSSSGEPILNSILHNEITLNGKVQRFKPTIVHLEKLRKLEWKGSLPLGMFTGHHCFEIESITSAQVKLIQSEFFSGWLSGIIFKQIKAETTDGFIRMNQELRDRAEVES